MSQNISPELRARIEELRQEIAWWDYPNVWLNEPGMTAIHLLFLQDLYEGVPEEMQILPGQKVGVEGDSEGGLLMPKVGGTRLYAPEVLRHLSGEMHSEMEIDLRLHVAHVQAAKRGTVLVYVADDIEWKPKEMLNLDFDICHLLGFPQFETEPHIAIENLPPIVGVWINPRYEEVSVDDLAPEHVDHELLERLITFADTGAVGYYVIPETPKVKDYLAEFGEYFGEPRPSDILEETSFAADRCVLDASCTLRFYIDR